MATTRTDVDAGLVKGLLELKAKGVPIDGIGFQFHYRAEQAPTADQIVANFSRFAALGLDVSWQIEVLP